MKRKVYRLKMANMPIKKVLTRLGYRENTSIDSRMIKMIESIFHDMLNKIVPAAIVITEAVKEIEGDTILLQSGFEIKSSDFIRRSIGNKDKKHIKYISTIAATLDGDYNKVMADFEMVNDNTALVIADAVGSELIEYFVDYINEIIEKEARIMRLGCGFRYSPGYGNMDLKIQKDIISYTNAREIGLDVSNNYILLPEKSITAFIALIK